MHNCWDSSIKAGIIKSLCVRLFSRILLGFHPLLLSSLYSKAPYR